MDIQESVMRFIRSRLAIEGDQAKIRVGQSLLDGVLDSIDFLRLVVFIESEFHIRVPDEDVVPENFASVQRISEYIRKRTASAIDRS